jgi:hypothetical protein
MRRVVKCQDTQPKKNVTAAVGVNASSAANAAGAANAAIAAIAAIAPAVMTKKGLARNLCFYSS